jgi:hypothetical protein
VHRSPCPLLLTTFFCAVQTLGCLTPPLRPSGGLAAAVDASGNAAPPALEKMTELDAWAAVPLMSPGINIGNTLDNTTTWETGWGNPPIITGYSTDITKTCASATKLPTDTIPGRLFMSVHYYTPYQFCGLIEDADWGKMMLTWGTADNNTELEKLFDMMGAFCTRNDIPAFIGEFGVTAKKEPDSRIRWMSAVFNASITRKMVPVLWDTGGEVSRNHPYAATPELQQTLRNLAPPPAVSTPAVKAAPTHTSPPVPEGSAAPTQN